jgi:hypothetical protein
LRIVNLLVVSADEHTIGLDLALKG